MEIEQVKAYLLNIDMPIKKLVFSDRLGGDFSKIVLRPVAIKGQNMFQVERFKGTQVFHSNLPLKNAVDSVELKNFKQILVEGEGKTISFSISKSGFKKKEQTNNITQENITTAHNKTKNYLLNEGDDVPIMQDWHFHKRKQNCCRNVR